MNKKNIHIFLQIFSFTFLLLFASCKNSSQEIAETQKENAAALADSQSYSLATCKPIELKGKIIEGSAPKIVKAGTPEITSGFNNIHPVGKLKTIDGVTGLDISDSINPTTIKANGREIICADPKIVVALLPGMREQNPIGFKFFDIAQGLNSSYIACMLQDKNGNIWFGTKGGGVSKYDGSEFITYTEKQGLPNNFVVSMVEDKDGNIWFGTDGGGACRYDGKSFTLLSEKEGLINNAVWSMLADSKGNMWFGTAGGGVSKYDGTNFSYYNKDNGFPTNYVISLAEDKRGNIWMGTYGDGLIKYNSATAGGKDFTWYTENDGLSNGIITALTIDHNGNVWMSTDGGGACKFNGSTFTQYTESAGLTSNSLNAVLEDKKGNIWFGTNERGVCKYDGSNFTCFTEFEGLSNNTILCLLQDRNEDLWFGTGGHGVTKYDRSCFTHFTKKEGLPSNSVYKTFEDHNKNLWFGTNGGGVSKYDGESYYTYTDKEGLNNNRVWSILEDHDHNMWFGTNGGGVCKFDGKNFYQYAEAQGLSGDKVYCMLQDCHNNYWFGTNGGGVCFYDGKNFTRYTKEEGFSNDIVYSIMEDADGNIWFGTDGGGAVKFTGKSFTAYTTKEGLPSNVVYSILQDHYHSIWFGTDDGGVSKFDQKAAGENKFTTYTEKDGLSNNRVWSMLQDMRGNIWLGTESGITKVNLKKNQGPPEFTTYDVSDGFLGSDAVQNSVFQDGKGFIWWGTGKMLTRYDPSQDISDALAPLMHLKNVKLHFENVGWDKIKSASGEKYSGVDFSSLTKWYPVPENLSLPHNQNHLTFNYVGINFKSQNKILYRYQLDGLEDKWTPPTSKTEAVYGNLPPGNFTFKVKALNKDGIWSDALSYSFVIRPPWWQTWWFRIFAFLFVVTGIVVVFRLRMAALRQRQKELEETVVERTAEVVQQKELVEEKQKEIVDSINYAKRIQLSILPPQDEMKEALRDYFVLYKPKDIVSGDFYWMVTVKHSATLRPLAVVAAVDCTGHGVPGALMSIISNTLLNQTTKNPDINSPAEALSFLNTELPKNLKAQQKGEIIRDGMDIIMCAFDFEKYTVDFAGANNSLYVFTNNELKEIKADKQAISGSTDEIKKPYTNHKIQLQKGDVVYLFTDGYADQFGGPKGKKFKHKQLEQILVDVARLPMGEQKQILDSRFEEWRGTLEQVDDVTAIGVRL
jgi:ligand-binding sensor domain-containing protein/serine phosphatase RsbU (regulator of sigma subunit)